MMDSLRVLMVDDEASDAKPVMLALGGADRKVHFERVDDAKAMRAALLSQRWDVIISDWSMPNFSALEALECVKELGLAVPFIVVSGTVGEDVAVEAMRAGAQDFVLKGKLVRLVPAIERELAQTREREIGRQTLDTLRSTQARFTRLWDSGIVGISIGDLFGIVREANDAFLRAVGHSRSDLRAGRVGWGAMTAPEFRSADDLAADLLQSQGFAPAWEKEIVRKDGKRISVVVGVAMLDDPSCMVVMTDVTDRKRAERALAEVEEQLRQAQKMEAIALLAGGVAHDFNNILSVILSYAGMLLGDLPEGDAKREGVEEIRQAGHRAAALTRQLLLFSRYQVTEPTAVELNEVLGTTDKMIRRILGEDIELVSLRAAHDSWIIGDPGQIEQIIMNLVVNARDAMPKGGKLTLETANLTLDKTFVDQHLGVKTGQYVMLAVTDTGIGMSKETQARIFEPFFTTKERGKGTGLGLSTVFGIVSQSGGTIWVYSEPGAGTTFKVYFPRSHEDVGDAQKPKSQPILAGVETILLVEDEEPVRAAARTVLIRNGYTVMEARTPEEALDTSHKHSGPIHLLLTDIVMPRISGPELARQLRLVRSDIKVLCMSGYTDDTIVRHGLLDAKMAFLQKPLTPEALLTRVREVLDGKR